MHGHFSIVGARARAALPKATAMVHLITKCILLMASTTENDWSIIESNIEKKSRECHLRYHWPQSPGWVHQSTSGSCSSPVWLLGIFELSTCLWGPTDGHPAADEQSFNQSGAEKRGSCCKSEVTRAFGQGHTDGSAGQTWKNSIYLKFIPVRYINWCVYIKITYWWGSKFCGSYHK